MDLVLTLLNLRVSKITKYWLPSASYCLLVSVVDSFCVYPLVFTLHSICAFSVNLLFTPSSMSFLLSLIT